MSPHEAEQLGNLLLSNIDENVLLALTLLERQPTNLQYIPKQALVYYFFTYLSSTERIGKMVYSNWQPIYFMTQEGRELEPRDLLKEWLENLLPDFIEEEHCLYFLTQRDLVYLHATKEEDSQALPAIERLEKDVEELRRYTSFIDGQPDWAGYYYKFANYLRRLLINDSTTALSQQEHWAYQKVLLEYLRKAQQQAPQDQKIAMDIALMLHYKFPAKAVREAYAQEVIDNYLIAAYIPDPTAPMSQFTASFCYIELANFYRDILQQALSAHHYYEKSLQLAPSNDQAKLEWAHLLEQEGATARAAALRATVDPDYRPPNSP